MTSRPTIRVGYAVLLRPRFGTFALVRRTAAHEMEFTSPGQLTSRLPAIS
jgi:hypothetical protein